MRHRRRPLLGAVREAMSASSQSQGTLLPDRLQRTSPIDRKACEASQTINFSIVTQRQGDPEEVTAAAGFPEV